MRKVSRDIRRDVLQVGGVQLIVGIWSIWTHVMERKGEREKRMPGTTNVTKREIVLARSLVGQRDHSGSRVPKLDHLRSPPSGCFSFVMP
jgi:hypothetical protein